MTSITAGVLGVFVAGCGSETPFEEATCGQYVESDDEGKQAFSSAAFRLIDFPNDYKGRDDIPTPVLLWLDLNTLCETYPADHSLAEAALELSVEIGGEGQYRNPSTEPTAIAMADESGEDEDPEPVQLQADDLAALDALRGANPQDHVGDFGFLDCSADLARTLEEAVGLPYDDCSAAFTGIGVEGIQTLYKAADLLPVLDLTDDRADNILLSVEVVSGTSDWQRFYSTHRGIPTEEIGRGRYGPAFATPSLYVEGAAASQFLAPDVVVTLDLAGLGYGRGDERQVLSLLDQVMPSLLDDLTRRFDS